MRFLVTRLTELQHDAEDGYNESIADVIDEMRRLEARNTVIRIDIVGCLSAGKSTFLNQLLGHNVLPYGDGSVTAVPTFISYKATPFRAEFHFLSQ